MYDIIGDIHGHTDELTEMLELLGYQSVDGVPKHPDRTAVFVGDLIDRGPQIREVLHLVHAMCESGNALAVMGNHEFNALAYHTPDPSRSGCFLREHSDKNTKQHAATLAQVPQDELETYLEWFRRLPMWLSLNGVRVVHACWDTEQIAVIEAARDTYGGVTAEFLCDATHRGTPLYRAIDEVLKGKEVSLPEGMSYHDKDGHERNAMRIRWFRSPASETYASYALTVDDGIPAEPLPSSMLESVTPYPADANPVLFGHYWLRAEQPFRLEHNVACVDFSVAKGGCLCAYRWDGESKLSNDKFVSVQAK